jgi:hypothetical protein
MANEIGRKKSRVEMPGSNSLEEALGGQHFSSVEEHFPRYERWRYGCVVESLLHRPWTNSMLSGEPIQ